MKSEKGTICLVLTYRVPVVRKKRLKDKFYDYKLLKSKLKNDITKEDLINCFNTTANGEMDETFEELN